MNRSTVYLLALCAGTFAGWLAQQFWFAGLDQQLLSSEQSLIRNEQRLKVLQEARRQAESVSLNSPADEIAIAKNSDSDPRLMADQLLLKELLVKEDFKSILNVADYKLAQGDEQGSILYLYDLRPQIDYQYESEYMGSLHKFVANVEKAFEKDGRVAQLIDLYRQLVNLEPDYVPYYLSLAQWLIVVQEWDEAEQALSSAKHDVQFSEETELLEQAIADLRERSDMYVIPLQKSGEHYLLELNLDETHNLMMMIDTGASMSVLKTEFVQNNFPNLLLEAEELRLKTANGLVSGEKIRISNVALSDLVLSDVSLGVLPLPEFSYDGLLGMDILKRFDFRIDQEGQQLILSPLASF